MGRLLKNIRRVFRHHIFILKIYFNSYNQSKIHINFIGCYNTNTIYLLLFMVCTSRSICRNNNLYIVTHRNIASFISTSHQTNINFMRRHISLYHFTVKTAISFMTLKEALFDFVTNCLDSRQFSNYHSISSLD